MKHGLVLLLLPLVACTTQQSGRVVSATVTPLSDLNLVNEKIPDLLKGVQQAPYAPPDKRGCATLRAEIIRLDQVLGPDLDTPNESTTSVAERAGNYVADRAAGTVRATTESLIPFRSWVRKLSGAERHSRQVAAALHAGTVRRAYLKGMTALQCQEKVESSTVHVAEPQHHDDSVPGVVADTTPEAAPPAADLTQNTAQNTAQNTTQNAGQDVVTPAVTQQAQDPVPTVD